jgi:hypothetical protein
MIVFAAQPWNCCNCVYGKLSIRLSIQRALQRRSHKARIIESFPENKSKNSKKQLSVEKFRNTKTHRPRFHSRPPQRVLKNRGAHLTGKVHPKAHVPGSLI